MDFKDDTFSLCEGSQKRELIVIHAAFTVYAPVPAAGVLCAGIVKEVVKD